MELEVAFAMLQFAQKKKQVILSLYSVYFVDYNYLGNINKYDKWPSIEMLTFRFSKLL